MKITKEELQVMENHVRTLITNHITHLPKEKMISLLLIASNNIGTALLGKEPETVEDTIAVLETGLNTLFSSYSNAKQQCMHLERQNCNIIDAAVTSQVGHA